ncbi:MAG: tRNA (adenosine(37)-N6)-threonylcarbamoyltransferase complex dimerization subunit type 1 TsaB [Fibrobacteria bacterium]|nr:tRNA (adenosine(37)-N6)-threonylcarbamoyltransferase complex dimerization subunit type 1 TsaB [Fibrobacteria bacterium]
MIRLCLDASTSTAVLGIFHDGRELSSRRLPGARGDVLPDLLAECLREAGLEPMDIHEVACGVGPGSFTGIRIALSTALGFSFRRKLPVRGVSSLQAALSSPALDPASGRIALLDALRGEVFVSVLGAGVAAHPGTRADLRKPLSEVEDLSRPAIVLAEGRAPLLESLPSGWLPLGDHVSASGIDRLAGLPGTVDPLPNYLRASAPEEMRAGL